MPEAAEATFRAALAQHADAFPLEQAHEKILENREDNEALIVRAEGILEDRIQLQGVKGRIVRLPDGQIDWKDRGPRGDPEWSWFLNRHGYLKILLAAWLETGDPRFRDRLLADLDDWIRNNPYPDRLTFSAAWRPLEVARRIVDTWPWLWLHLRDEPSFSPDQRLRFLLSLLDHADSLRDHASFWGGNHLLTESSALAAIALFFPSFKDSDAWLRHATDRFTRQLLRQTYPDGAYKELSNHYQLVVLREVERFQQLWQLASAGNSSPAELESFREHAERMWRYVAGVARPDGFGPLNNAADLDHNRNAIERSSTHDWNELRPTHRIRLFPWAGQVVMTDRPEMPQEWAFFDAGPLGSAHDHHDRLHLSVFFGGRPFLADRGRYSYQPGPWRDYFKGPSAHNTVLLNRNAPLPGPRVVRQPLRIDHKEGAEWASFSAENIYPSGPLQSTAASRHRRTVLYLPGRAWLVIDQIFAFGPNEATFHWNFAPAIDQAEAEQHFERSALAPDPAGGSRSTFIRGQESPPLAWSSVQYGSRQPALVRVDSLRIAVPTAALWTIRPDPRTHIKVIGWSPNGGRITVETPEQPPLSLHIQLRDGAPVLGEI